MPSDPFIYHQNHSTKVFPIDYTLREFDEKHNGNVNYIERVIQHQFIKDVLVDLIWYNDSQRQNYDYENGGPYPLPVETETLLRVFYKLIWEKYCKEDVSSLKTDFSIDLCLGIAESVFTPDDSKRFDDAEYCKRVLCNDNNFCHVLMDNLWENEINNRIAQIKQLTATVSPGLQMRILEDVLSVLDRTCLELIRWQEHPQPNSETSDPNGPPDPKVLLKKLLSKRRKVKEDPGKVPQNKKRVNDIGAAKKRITYEVENAFFTTQPINGKTEWNLKTAFDELEALSKSNSPLMKPARLAYLRNLENEVSPSAFEKRYLGLRQYLDVVSGALNSSELRQRFIDIMKEQCRHEIDNMVHITENKEEKFPEVCYLEQLVYDAAKQRAARGIQCFDDTIELVKMFATLADAPRETKIFLPSHSEKFPGNDIYVLYCPPVYRKDYFVNLQTLFVKYWKFAGYNCPIDESGHFKDLKWIAKKFAKGAQEAVSFFNKGSKLIRSADQVYELLKACESYVVQEDDYMLAWKVADISLPILSMVMLQTLQRIAVDGVSGLMRDFPKLQKILADAKKEQTEQNKATKATKTKKAAAGKRTRRAKSRA